MATKKNSNKRKSHLDRICVEVEIRVLRTSLAPVSTKKGFSFLFLFQRLSHRVLKFIKNCNLGKVKISHFWLFFSEKTERIEEWFTNYSLHYFFISSLAILIEVHIGSKKELQFDPSKSSMSVGYWVCFEKLLYYFD